MQDYLAKRIEGSVTAPETWIIPFALASNSELSFSPIGLDAARRAERQFGSQVYTEHLFVGIKSFYMSLLDKTPGATIFIEKTPRNVFYYEEICKFLPSATRILLIRHPLEIVFSSFQYFCYGRPNLSKVSIDLIHGIDALCQIVQKGSDIIVRYEDLKADKAREFEKELKVTGLAFCKHNAFYENTVLKCAGMGDAIFKSGEYASKESDNGFEVRGISLFTYLVVTKLLRRPSYQYLLETFYNESPTEASRRLGRYINRLGVIDCLSYCGSAISALVNLKIVVFKFRMISAFGYLR